MIGGLQIFTLHLESSKGVDRLGGQADVCHNRNLGIQDGFDHRNPFLAAFQLDRLGPGFLDETPRIAHCFFYGYMIG